MQNFLDVLTIVGASLGLVAFVWRIWDSFLSYVNADLQVTRHGEFERTRVTALATLENRGSVPKRVHHVGLLLGPAWMPLEDVAGRVSQHSDRDPAGSPSHPVGALPFLSENGPVYRTEQGCAWIPLPFFYRDQKRLGNETVRYRCEIDIERLGTHAHCRYVVFLLIFVRYPPGILRWRATGDMLLL